MTFRSANASESIKPPEPAALSVLAAGKVAPALGKGLGLGVGVGVAGTYYDAKLSGPPLRVARRQGPDRRGPGRRELDSARTTLKQDATIPGTAELQRTKRDFRTFIGGDAITGGGGAARPASTWSRAASRTPDCRAPHRGDLVAHPSQVNLSDDSSRQITGAASVTCTQIG